MLSIVSVLPSLHHQLPACGLALSLALAHLLQHVTSLEQNTACALTTSDVYFQFSEATGTKLVKQ